MVMPSECPFCGKKYGDAEEHYCGSYEAVIRDRCTNEFCDYNMKNGAICRGKNCPDYFSDGEYAEEFSKTLIAAGMHARVALKEFADAINKEAKKSYETLRKIWDTNGKSVPSKDDN